MLRVIFEAIFNYATIRLRVVANCAMVVSFI
jgi:hypothetical protein